MQYILTEEEYRELCEVGREAEREFKRDLQRACTLAAQYTPVPRYWDEKDRSPWGCILTPSNKDPGYCDECPVKRECPHDDKRFSK